MATRLVAEEGQMRIYWLGLGPTRIIGLTLAPVGCAGDGGLPGSADVSSNVSPSATEGTGGVDGHTCSSSGCTQNRVCP